MDLQARLGHEEFSDDDPHPGQADIDFDRRDQIGDAGRENDFDEQLGARRPEGAGQDEMIGVGAFEALVHDQRGDDDGDGHAHGDDRSVSGADGDDEQGSQGHLGHAVEDHQVRVQYPREHGRGPDQRGQGGAGRPSRSQIRSASPRG